MLFANPCCTDYVIYLPRAVPKTRPLIDEWHPVWTSEMFPLAAVTCGLFGLCAGGAAAAGSSA
jgi:hypothetical protein